DQSYKNFRLKVEDVQRNVLTNFHEIHVTIDQLTSLVTKWETLIEAHIHVKTTNNFTLRIICIRFTKKRDKQVKRTCCARSSQIREIRRKMVEIMVYQASSSDLKELVAKFIPEMIGKDIEKATSSIYPLQGEILRRLRSDLDRDNIPYMVASQAAEVIKVFNRDKNSVVKSRVRFDVNLPLCRKVKLTLEDGEINKLEIFYLGLPSATCRTCYVLNYCRIVENLAWMNEPVLNLQGVDPFNEEKWVHQE
ncbi:hypothetical protein MKX03_030152, partial [Papaver bracteatum]